MKKTQMDFEKRKAEVMANPKVQAIIQEKMESGRRLIASGSLDKILNKKS
nr:hypothetical protein [uncultured Dyadobacter sp.]